MAVPPALRGVDRAVALGVTRIRSAAWRAVRLGAFREALRAGHGIGDVEPVRVGQWHLACRYFRARSADGAPLFVKLGDHGFAERERAALAAVAAVRPDACDGPGRCVAVPTLSHTTGANPWVAFAWTDAPTLADVLAGPPADGRPRADVHGPALVPQLAELADVLDAAALVHRDVRPANLFVEPGPDGPRLVLFDFAFAIGPGPLAAELPMAAARRSVLLGLGEDLKPGPFTWDDAWSLRAVAALVDPRRAGDAAAWARLDRAVGRRVHSAA